MGPKVHQMKSLSIKISRLLKEQNNFASQNSTFKSRMAEL